MAAHTELRAMLLTTASDTASANESRVQQLISQLPQVQAASRDALNLWLAGRGPFSFETAGRSFKVTWSTALSESARWGIEIAFGSHTVCLAMDGLAAIDPSLIGEPFSRMPVSLRDLFVERTLARFVSLLPATLANTLELRAVYWRSETLPRWNCALGFTLTCLTTGAASKGAISVASPETLRWLHQQLPMAVRGVHPEAQSLRLSLRVFMGSTRLDRETLFGLSAGDVVWADCIARGAYSLSATLFAPGGAVWACRIRGTRLRIQTALAPGLASAASISATDAAGGMQSHFLSYLSASPGDGMSSERSALEIPVTIDLGELSLTLATIERLQAGQLFDLPQEAANAVVNLRVAGRLVAQGKLVAIERRLGVCIDQVHLGRNESGAV